MASVGYVLDDVLNVAMSEIVLNEALYLRLGRPGRSRKCGAAYADGQAGGRVLDHRAYSHGWNVLEQLRGWSMQDCIAHRDASTPNVLYILVAIEKLLQPGREEGADF
jgi:hypothetical protein